MGVLRVKVGNQWIDIPGGVGGGSGGSGGGTDEVVISTADPISTYPTAELWFDPSGVAPPPSGGVAASYRHVQGTAAATWIIDHNLGFYPNVVVEDSTGTTVEGEIVFDSTNRVTLSFSAAFSGTAYLS